MPSLAIGLVRDFTQLGRCLTLGGVGAQRGPSDKTPAHFLTIALSRVMLRFGVIFPLEKRSGRVSGA